MHAVSDIGALVEWLQANIEFGLTRQSVRSHGSPFHLSVPRNSEFVAAANLFDSLRFYRHLCAAD